MTSANIPLYERDFHSHVFANLVKDTIYFIFQYIRCRAIFMEMLWINHDYYYYNYYYYSMTIIIMIIIIVLGLWLECANTLITFTIIIIIKSNPIPIKKTSKCKTTLVIYPNNWTLRGNLTSVLAMETFLDTNKLKPIWQKNYKIQLCN